MKATLLILFNKTALTLGFITTLLFSIIGGKDNLTEALLVAMVLDYISGLVKAGIKKKLNSKTGFKGILKKVMYIIVVAIAVKIDGLIGQNTWRSAVIGLLFANEVLSILENASVCGVPIPEKLKKILKQYKDETTETLET